MLPAVAERGRETALAHPRSWLPRTEGAPMSAAGALPPSSPPPPLAAHRLARLLVRARFRHVWNALRARPAGPAGLLLLLGVGSALGYVVLLANAFEQLGDPAAGGGP